MSELWLSGYDQEIERCTKIYESFKEGAGFVRAVFDSINVYFEKDSEHAPPFQDNNLSPDVAADMMRKDTSLFLRPLIDRKLFCALFKLVCSTIIKTNPALKQTISNTLKLADNYFSENKEKVTLEEIDELKKIILKEKTMSDDLATLVFSLVQTSIYRRQLKMLPGLLRTDLYEGGDCPVCGKKPHYGLLHPDNGAKHMECWLCGTRWVHPRVKCPYCSNEKREELGFFTVEGNDTCRVNYCQVCCCYYKVYDARTFHVDGDLVLPVHNLASLDYDLLAGKEGFLPGSGLKWVNDEELSNRQD